MIDLSPPAVRLLQLAVHRPALVGPVLRDEDPDGLFLGSEVFAALARLLGGWTAQRTADASSDPEIKRRLPWMASIPWCGVAHGRGEVCACPGDPAEVRRLVAEVKAWRSRVIEDGDVLASVLGGGR